MQIPIDDLVIPLAASTTAFWILAAYFLRNLACTSYASATVGHRLLCQDYTVVLNSAVEKNASGSSYYLWAWEWDTMAAGLLPFSFGWLILSTLYVNITTNNGCR